MNTVYIMSGLPGSGKTHYCNEYGKNDIVLHRDEFRASLRKELNINKYFPVSSREEQKLWAKEIEKTIPKAKELGKSIWIDQTTLTEKALRRIINLFDEDWKIIIVMMATEFEECLTRNKTRSKHEFVPEKVIRDMENNYHLNLNKIYKSYPNREIKIELVF